MSPQPMLSLAITVSSSAAPTATTFPLSPVLFSPKMLRDLIGFPYSLQDSPMNPLLGPFHWPMFWPLQCPPHEFVALVPIRSKLSTLRSPFLHPFPLPFCHCPLFQFPPPLPLSFPLPFPIFHLRLGYFVGHSLSKWPLPLQP